MGVLNLCMKKNPFSRAFHCILLLPCLVLVVLASVSLGTFVPLHRDIANYVEGSAVSSGDDAPKMCILFATPNRDTYEDVDYQDDNSCDFMIWGQLAVASLAVAMGAVLIIKAFAGTKVFSCSALIELLLTVAGFIFTLALGVVITVGLTDTCNAYDTINDRNDDTDFMPCEEFEYDFNSEIRFYDALNTSRVVTWIEAGVLLLLLIWYGLVNLINCATCITSHTKSKPKPTKLKSTTS